MNIGSLRHRALIQYPATTQDATYGTPVVTWTTLATVWCSVEDLLPNKSESINQGLVVATGRTRIRMRYRSDLTSAMRLTINRPSAQIYQIVAGPVEIGNQDGIELIVEKYSSDLG
jgi:SPP1 family predicted phage head-tail adaptor